MKEEESILEVSKLSNHIETKDSIYLWRLLF